MSKYESVAAFSVKGGEEAANALVAKFQTLIEANGTMEKVDNWGVRKLAYECGNHETDALYVVYTFEAGVDFPAELDRIYNITDGVLRHVVVAK